MLRIGTSVSVFAAVYAASVVFGISAAFAAFPEFKPSTKQTFTGKGAVAVISTSGVSITCTTTKDIGSITGTTTVGKVVQTFIGCASKKGVEPCKVKSVGAGEGEIVIKTLKGELGEVAPAEAIMREGLLLEPETTKKLTTLAAGCPMEGELLLEGSVAGEIEAEATAGGLYLEGASGKQDIKSITVKSGSKKPSLKLSGVAATEEDSETLGFEKEVELPEAAPPVTVVGNSIFGEVPEFESKKETYTFTSHKNFTVMEKAYMVSEKGVESFEITKDTCSQTGILRGAQCTIEVTFSAFNPIKCKKTEPCEALLHYPYEPANRVKHKEAVALEGEVK